MKILLTGITGCVGHYLASCWQDNKQLEVIGISRSKVDDGLKIPVFYGDLADMVFPEEPVDAIVHSAALSPSPGGTTEDFICSNVDSVRNLISYARKNKIKKFIYLSSISINGEINADFVDENTPVIDPDIYGLTKYLGEMLLKDEEAWLSSFSLRLCGVLGERAKTPWLTQVANKLKKGEEVCVYNPESLFNNIVYLDDLEKFISNLLIRDSQGFEMMTLGCREPITISQVVDLMKKHLNSTSSIQIKETSKKSFMLSIDKACRFGYSPRTVEQILLDYCKNLNKEL